MFKTADGYLMVTALFRSFGDLMIDLEKATGVDGLSTDDRFQDLESAITDRLLTRYLSLYSLSVVTLIDTLLEE